MIKKHWLVLTLVLLLTVGFATINTVLNINGSLGLGETDFEVKFNRAILNGANRTSLFNINKTAIRLSYTDISNISESVLEYEIVNKSTQYDADVTITCSAALSDNTEFTYGENKSLTPEPIRVEAGKFGTGKVNIKVNKNENNDTTENLGTLFNIVKNQSQGLDTDNSLNYNKFTTSDSKKGVFETTNTDTGKSVYFYRGVTENNNVLFGNRCWNIIRTTETNGVKLIYTGNPVDGACLPFGTQMNFGLVPKSKWTNNEDDNAYVGYMYGDINSTTYAATHQNKHNSLAKEKIDEWYEKNLKGTKYENYLEDTVFCNDRSLATNFENIYQDEGEEPITNNLGYGRNKTYYAASARSTDLSKTALPTLKCTNLNDRFTVNKTNGNGALDYPIGLITTDELIYVGGSTGTPYNNHKDFYKKNFLMYTGTAEYYTMTPDLFNNKKMVTYNRPFSLGSENPSEERFLIPVISVNSNILVLKGDGTKKEPYILETEDINENSYTCTIDAKPISRTSYNKFDLDQLKTGDEYCIGEECFYVVSNENNMIKLLAKYNLYVGSTYSSVRDKEDISWSDPLYGKQNRKALGYTLTGEYPYIGVTPYSAISQDYKDSYAEGYVDEYVWYLKNTYKIGNIKGNLITVEDLENLGCDKAAKTCNTSWYDWITGMTYWVNTADPNDTTKTYLVGADGFLGASAYSNINNRGIRPLITIYMDIDDLDEGNVAIKTKLYDKVKSLSQGPDINANINYDEISSQSNGTGVFETNDTDSEKPVYFYRGNVDNNVTFVNSCWKIIRTTETNGTKLIYNGPVKNGSCLNSNEETIIGSSAYSSTVSDNAYIGYMYGTPNSSSYAITHANINDSTIKKVVDSWYEKNLKGKKYEYLIEDAVYCNDRSVESPGINNNLVTTKYGILGYGNNNTGYGVVSRIANAALKTKPTYKCKQPNDRFTVSSSNGNGALKYPIGLITADETAFAGGTRFRDRNEYSNESYYLYNNLKFYTMSPNWFDGRIAIGAVNAQGTSKNGYVGLELANIESGVRPVISLKNEALVLGGDGSKKNPYNVKEIDDINKNDIPYYWLDNGIFQEYYVDAYRALSKLTLEEKVGQLIMAHHNQATAIEGVTKYNIGGYTYFEADFLGKTEEEVKKMIADEQAASKIPLITAVDEEGGRVVRISLNTNLVRDEINKYPNMFYTNTNNKNAWRLSKDLYEASGNNFTLIENETKVKSGVLKRLGLNVNFAPVVDMAIPGSYISDRVIGLDANLTAEYGKRVINASKGTGVSYTLKHFPGYGNNSDTHESGSVDNKTLEELMENDIIPFKEGIRNGAEAVMISHNTVSAIDNVNPASLSKEIHNLLTNDLDFTGIIITDALDMGATKEIPNKFTKAIEAGNHLILVQDYENAYKEILESVKNGIISETKISRLAFKVLAWKYYKGLM